MPICSLNCFLDFAESKSLQRRESIIRTYKALQEKLADGMFRYHGPALQALRSRLRPGQGLGEQRVAIAEACLKADWTAKRNDRRIASNLSVFDSVSAQRNLFPAQVVSSERFAFAGSHGVTVNVCPDLSLVGGYGQRLVKLGLRQKPRKSEIIQIALQIMSIAAGRQAKAEQVVFFDTAKEELSHGFPLSDAISSRISDECREFRRIWNAP